MTKKKIIITGVITLGILAAIVTCITMTGKEESVETIAEIQAADEPEAETEKVEPVMEEVETAQEEEEELAGLPPETTDEAETDKEELQTVNSEEETVNEDIEDIEATMYATTDVNLRKGTAVTTESLRLVAFAEEVKVTGITTNKQWYRVEDTEKGEGFIASSYLSDTKPQQNTSSQQASSGSSESTQYSSDSTGTQSGGGSSSVPGISQAEMDKIDAALAGLQSGYVQTGENANPNADGAGHFLNR